MAAVGEQRLTKECTVWGENRPVTDGWDLVRPLAAIIVYNEWKADAIILKRLPHTSTIPSVACFIPSLISTRLRRHHPDLVEKDSDAVLSISARNNSSFGTRRLHYCIPNPVRRIAMPHFVNVLTLAASTVLSLRNEISWVSPIRDIASAKWRV
jgi:hypothetical protein